MKFSEKQIHILRKAEKLFAQKGCEATTVRDIAAGANVNLAMISYYFGSKEKLIEALFEERLGTNLISIKSIIFDVKFKSPIEKIDAMIDKYIDSVFERKDFYIILQNEQILNKNQITLKYIRQIKLGYASIIGDEILAGLKQKIFTNKVDIIFLMSTMTGIVTQLLIDKKLYIEYNNLQINNDNEHDRILIDKLSSELKKIFRNMAGYNTQ